MNTNIRSSSGPADKSNLFFLVTSISLLAIMPAVAVMAEVLVEAVRFQWTLFAKWFIFWASGMRLFTAGIKQASNPEFTAREIFRFNSKDSFVVIRELGFANIAIGAMGILSVINDHWRLLASITSCIYFGLAALQHFSRRPAGINEFTALIYDTTVFIVLLTASFFLFPLIG